MDLHVIGAGPAGSISAISAIRNRNARVAISEQCRRNGLEKSCSGLFSIDGLETLREFVDYRKTGLNRIYGAEISLAGEKLVVKAKKPVALVCDRKRFDDMLALNAEKEGAEMRFGEQITDSFLAEDIIGADGANSHVADHFHFPKIKKFVATLKAKMRYEAEDPKLVEVFFSNSRFPGFFGWVIPHNEEEAEFGCGVELPGNPKKAFDALLKMKEVATAGRGLTGAIIPISARPRTAMQKDGKNILLAGDAAGQVKSTTGGGVIFGGNCARLAGRFFDDPLGYELNWKKELGLDLHAHSLAHGYLARKNEGQLRRLGVRLRRSGLETYLSEHGHMDRPSRMLGLKLIKLLPGFVKIFAGV